MTVKQLVAAANKVFISGEYTWNSQTSGDGDLSSFFQTIEKNPAAAGDFFWSMFGHNVPDCNVGDPHPVCIGFFFSQKLTPIQSFVNHNDGLTLQVGNPANSAFTNSRIQLIRQHFVKMSQGETIGADEALPVVPCPAPENPEEED